MLLKVTRQTSKIFSCKGSRFVFPCSLALVTIFFLNNYLQGTATVLLAGAAAVASTTKKARPVKRHRYAITALILAALTWLVPVSTLLYFAVTLTLFYWIELYYASVHFLGIVALFFSSPAFQYASGVFSFPIRLQLTKIVGSVFSMVTSGIKLNGNTIFYGDREFAVDPACMGLHMLSISMLLGIFLLGLLQKKAGKRVNWKAVVLYLACLFAFNLIANVLRIILLVQFAVLPEVAMHDIIGLLCLLLYVCLPACMLAKAIVSKEVVRQESNEASLKKPSLILQWMLIAALLFVAQRVATIDTYLQFNSKYTQVIRGYTSSVYAPGILKLKSEQSLLYVKFIRGFYDTEHNPSMCWKGSGWTFKDLKKQSIGGQEMYTAVLTKNEDKLYTAWWYGNSNDATTSQWQWRWNMLKGREGYAVVNVTAASEAALQAEVQKLLVAKTLASLFKD
jgi:exosortase N